MKPKIWFITLVVFWLACLYLFFNSYQEAKTEAVKDLNARQALHARQAARGVEGVFEHWIRLLEYLARDEAIIEGGRGAQYLMDHIGGAHPEHLIGLARVDREGRVRLISPHDDRALGTDVSGLPHFRKARSTGEPAVSDVLHSPRGFSTVAVHVRVMKGGEFDGVLAVALDFKEIAKKFISPIKIGDSGSAWVTSREGIELYCPIAGHTGRSVFETCREYPSILEMAADMLAGKRGTTTYYFHRPGQERGGRQKMHAVFLPIRFGDTFWSIVVASPEREVMAGLTSFRNRLIFLFLVLSLGGLLLGFPGMKAWGALREEERRRAAEAAQVRSEAKFRALFESAPIGIFQTTPGGAYKTVNPAYARMLGFDSPKEMVEGVEDIATLYVNPAQRKEILELMEKNGRLSGYETQLRRRDGREIWTAVFAVCVYGPEGDIDYFDGFSLDITDRKEAEKALRLSEERWQFALQGSRDGVWDWEAGTGRIYYSPRWKEVLGLAEDEPTDSFADWESRLHPEERKMVLGRLVSHLKGETDHFWCEHRLKRKDGSYVWVLDRGKVVQRDEAGKPLRTIGTMTDISEQKALELQLRQAQKMEAVGALAGGIAHDFNNLLQAINGYTQLLLIDKGEASPEHSNLVSIQNAANRAASLIRQLLLFSRKAETDRRTVDLNREVEEARKLFERILPKMVGIELNLEPGLWSVEADPVQLEQALLNLGGNAADAMPEGGKIMIRTRNLELKEPDALDGRQLTPGRYSVLTFSDTGSGMNQEMINHIFEPFYTTKDIGQGTGLGLASVYGVVKGHGGYIFCRSEVGRGTTFEIYLPAVEAAPAVEPETVPDPARGGGESILVVDDEAAIREVATETLTKFGYRVLAASSGEEALKVLFDDGAEVDLIIMDIGMPGMGGRRCIEEILKKDASALILVASGYARDLQAREALIPGAQGFIAKPYQLKELLQSVRSVLDQDIKDHLPGAGLE